jgi:hypothetical protein
MAIQVGAVFAFWAWELPLSHQVELGEAPVLAVVLFSKAGEPLYSYPTGLPLVQNPYGPVFEWLCAHLPSPASRPYLPGRAVSLASLAALGVLIAGWLRRRQVGWIEIFVALALMLATKPWILFGPLYRVDALAVFWSVLGFLLAISPRRTLVATSPLVFTLALSVKLTALAAPLAALVYLWTTHRKRCLWLLVGLLLLLPGSVLALQWGTDGAYLFNASFGNAPSHWFKAIELPSRISLSLLWLLAVGSALRRLGWKDSPETRALCAYAFASLLVAAVFATNPLSSWNYLMEFYAALAILTALLLARLRHDPADGAARNRILALLAGHAALGLLISTHAIWQTRETILEYRVRYEQAYDRIEPLVRAGRTVVVLDSLKGRDVLNGLGYPNLVSLPASVERQPEIQKLIARSLPGLGDAMILEGPTLNEQTPGSNRR